MVRAIDRTVIGIISFLTVRRRTFLARVFAVHHQHEVFQAVGLLDVGMIHGSREFGLALAASPIMDKGFRQRDPFVPRLTVSARIFVAAINIHAGVNATGDALEVGTQPEEKANGHSQVSARTNFGSPWRVRRSTGGVYEEWRDGRERWQLKVRDC